MGRAFKFWDLVSSILTRLPWGRIGNNYSKIDINTVYFKISPVHQKKCSPFIIHTKLTYFSVLCDIHSDEIQSEVKYCSICFARCGSGS